MVITVRGSGHPRVQDPVEKRERAPYHIVMDPFFHRNGPGFCSLETMVPGLVPIQVFPSSVEVERVIGPEVALIE
jgi:hypothetical protein